MVDSNEVQNAFRKKYLWDTSALIAFAQYLLPFDTDGELTDWLVAGFEKSGNFFLTKEVLKELERFWGQRKNKKVTWKPWEIKLAENVKILLSRLSVYEEISKKDNQKVWKILKGINYVPSKEIINPEEHKLILEKWATRKGKESLFKKQLTKEEWDKLNMSELDDSDLNRRVAEEVAGMAGEELKWGDFQLIFHARENKEFDIVTNESSSSNDRKLFYKIPVICGMEGIACTDLTQFLKNNAKGLHLKFEGSHQT